MATHGRPEAARAAAQEVARQRARWLSAVRDAAERAPSLEDGLRAALARVCAHLGWQAGRVEFASITGDLASRTIWHLEDGQELDRFRALAELRRDARESGLARRAINEGTPCSAILAGKEAGASRVRAVYAFPALFNRRPMAALEFFSEDARQQPQELLEAVAQCCAELGALFAKKPAEETLRHAERRYRELFESNADGLLVLDPDLGTVLEANPRACEVFGRTRAELVGLRLETLWGDPARARTALNQACRFELTVAQPHGPELAAEVTASAVLYLGRRAVLIHAREVPRIARTAEPRDPPLRGLDEPALLRAALYDPVTGLANRTLLRDRLLLAHARTKGREGGPHAVLVIDLDRFGLVNDSLGHRAGDELLHQVARRLEACRRSGDTVARLGGDDFALLIENARDDEDAVQVAERIHRALATPFLIAGHEVWMAARVGIARSLGDAGPEAVLQNASTALDRARQRGIRQAVFDASMHEQALASLRLGADLRRALERGQLVLHHQPVLWLSTGKARGVEALVRWNHPQRGLLPPGDFIPHAEQSGLVVPLGSYVLRRACAEIAGLGAPLTVSINVSAMQLLHPGLYQDVTETLQQTGLPPERLKLELTETMLVEAGPAAVAVLVRLRELGVRISIDDFGTGYSSLSYLHELPIDELKIDASFVRSMLSSPRLAKVVQSILLLGQGLGIEVVAEGVETEEQAAALRGMGCELAQGFLFARPIPLDDLSAWLSRTA